MPNTYTITIQNNSGTNQNYALFNEAPKLESSFFAYVGSSSGVPGQDDVTVSVSSANEVEFTGKVAASGKVGAFGIQTAAGNEQNQFTFNNAKDNGWVIGLGKIINGQTVPAATIIPQPNCNYQIQPKNTWYISYGTYTAGQVCNFEMSGIQKATVDFSNSANAKVIHSPGGEITTQTSWA